MTTLERIAGEVIGALLLIMASVVWWKIHNHTEQQLGAVACIAQTTETKAQAVGANTTDAAIGAAQLQLVVKTYDDQVADLQRGNADLVQRLHDNQVRAKSVSGTGSAAAGDLCPVDLSDGQRRALDARIAAEAKVLDDCDADYAGRVAVIKAYNQVRARALAAAAAAP
jgi:hypothetical protein